MEAPLSGARELDLTGCLILPGLINAHDHLEFSLFPRLGRGPYPDAEAWARDIYRPNDSPVREHLRVPKTARLFWGGIKNLLSGVTTVCHHNPYATCFDRNFPVRVVRRFGWAHSLPFSPDVRERFRQTPPGWPFILHLGEGASARAQREIFELRDIGALDERTVLVHAVALLNGGLTLAREASASIIWCPSSNLFVLGRTLADSVLRSGIPIALGSDSPLTAAGDLLDELRVAREVAGLSAGRLYEMVTGAAARILRLEEGSMADLVAIRDRGFDPANALLDPDLEIEMVMVGGRIKLASEAFAPRLPEPDLCRLQPLAVEGRGRFLVDADVTKLHRQAVRALGPEIRLAGRRVYEP